MDFLRPVWNCVRAFCSCLQCGEDITSQGYEPNERTHLLSDAVNSSPALGTNSDNLSNDYNQSVPRKDDQNALCRLVQNTAVNMIDVSAMDSHNMEHQECDDRIKMYSHRLQQQWSNIQNSSKMSKGILIDIPRPDKHLEQMVLIEDIMQMFGAFDKVNKALAKIKIDHKEAIVVPFRIP